MKKMTLKEAEKRFGHEAIVKLTDMAAEPTSRCIYPAIEPQHANMDEYSAGPVYVEGGKIFAYYFQPEGAEDWELGEMNGIEYGDIDNVEFIEED